MMPVVRVLVAWSLLALAGVAVASTAVRHGALAIEAPWSRATPPAATMAAGYFLVRNEGRESDELLGASSPRAARVELHRTIEEKGVSRMRRVAAVPVPAGQAVRAEPGGLHLMFVGIQAPFVAGERVPVTLTFRRAGSVTLEFVVAPIGARDPKGAATRAGHDHHHHHHQR